MNCTGVDFSDMSVTIISEKPSILNDSRIYIKENDPDVELTECGIYTESFDFTLDNNVISNFDTGIYSPPLVGKATRIGRVTNNTITFDLSEESQKRTGKNTGISIADSEVDIDNNEIINPDDGIEASQSSGRITNNTVTFDAGGTQKQKGGEKKGIYILNNSNMEVTSNVIISTDINSLSISGIEIENSSVIASYNVISFTEYTKGYSYYGFYTTGLEIGSQFINNTINNSTDGLHNIGGSYDIDFINNIVWGSDNGNVNSDKDILIAYNNDILGVKIGLKEDKDNFKFDPIYKSVKISDFYLNYNSPCIDTGFEDKDFHIYGTNFYGAAPDRGAIEYYVAVITDPESPANINISEDTGWATITWDSVTDANSYKIFGSDDPYGTFTYIKSTASTSWGTSVTGTKYFYYIIASTDAAKSDIEEPITLDKKTIVIKKPKKKILRKEEKLSNR